MKKPTAEKLVSRLIGETGFQPGQHKDGTLAALQNQCRSALDGIASYVPKNELEAEALEEFWDDLSARAAISYDTLVKRNGGLVRSPTWPPAPRGEPVSQSKKDKDFIPPYLGNRPGRPEMFK